MYKLYGGDGSPYSCKVRAVLRYRRVPFLWCAIADHGLMDGIFKKFPGIPKVIPILERPDGSYTNDSTPILIELDKMIKNGREIIPSNPALAFLAAVLEDFGDEWITKVMFEGRFHTEGDASFGAEWQAFQCPSNAAPKVRKLPAMFAQRQRGRRERIVGSSDWEVWEKCLRRVCEILESNLQTGHLFLFGNLPSNADFGLFGQMRQFAADPLPSKVMHQYPGAWGWVWRMDDLSGYPTEKGQFEVTPAALDLLAFAAETYFPFLLANEKALQSSAKLVEVQIFSGSNQKLHSQPPFKYQAKCLDVLRQHFSSLQGKDLEVASKALANVGALHVFQSPPAESVSRTRASL